MLKVLLYGKPLAIAAWRAVYSAALVGAGAALTVYKDTGDVHAAAVAGVTAIVLVLAARAGVEGYVDRKQPDSTPPRPLAPPPAP